MKRLGERKKKWIERTAKNNRSYKLYLYNRFFMFLVLVLVQIVAYVFAAYLIVYESPIAFGLQIAIAVLELVMLLYLINKNDRAASKLNWILLILPPRFLWPRWGGGAAAVPQGCRPSRG